MKQEDNWIQEITLFSRPGEGVVYLVGPPVGTGRHCVAYDGKNKENNIPCFLKKLRSPTQENKATFKRAFEFHVKLMSQTDNTTANLSGYLYDETGCPWVVMDKKGGAVLAEAKFASAHSLFQQFTQIAKGMQQYHDAGYLLMDMNPNNVFCLSDQGSLRGVYFFDFDSVIPVQEANSQRVVSAAKEFAPPELVLGEFDQIDYRSDYYALGSTLYWCLYGAVPSCACARYSYRRLCRAKAEYRNVIQCSTNVRTLLRTFFEKTLSVSPEDRFSSLGELIQTLENLCDESYPSIQRRLRTNLVLHPGEFYVPTIDKLDELKQYFLSRVGKPGIAIVHGEISGCGKTTLAIAAATDLHESYDAVMFVTYNPQKGFGGVLDMIAEHHELEREDVMVSLLSDHEPCLIIIDNYDQEQSNEPLPQWGNTHIILTTRYDADSFNGLCHEGACIRVEMECSESLALSIFEQVYCGITSKRITSEEREAARKLLEKMGYHTYAADLIARELAQSKDRRDFRAYADNIEVLWSSEVTSYKDAIAGMRTSTNSIQNHIDILFEDVLEQLRSPANKYGSIINALFYLFRQNRVWRKDWLCRLVGDDGKHRRKAEYALRELEQRGIVRQISEKRNDQGLTVHPLIQRSLQTMSFSGSEEYWAQWFLNNDFGHGQSSSFYVPGITSVLMHFLEPIMKRVAHQYIREEIPFQTPVGMAMVLCAELGWHRRSQKVDHCAGDILQRKHFIRTMYRNKRCPWWAILQNDLCDWMLCSIALNEGLLYFAYLPDTQKTYPLYFAQACYPEEYQANKLPPAIRNCDNAAVVIHHIFTDRTELVVPGRIEDMPVYGVNGIWSRLSMLHSLNQLCVSEGISFINESVFYQLTDGMTVMLPSTIKTEHKQGISGGTREWDLYSGNGTIIPVVFPNGIPVPAPTLHLFKRDFSNVSVLAGNRCVIYNKKVIAIVGKPQKLTIPADADSIALELLQEQPQLQELCFQGEIKIKAHVGERAAAWLPNQNAIDKLLNENQDNHLLHELHQTVSGDDYPWINDLSKCTSLCRVHAPTRTLALYWHLWKDISNSPKLDVSGEWKVLHDAYFACYEQNTWFPCVIEEGELVGIGGKPKRLVIPEKVNRIRASAFHFSEGLQEIIIEGSPKICCEPWEERFVFLKKCDVATMDKLLFTDHGENSELLWELHRTVRRNDYPWGAFFESCVSLRRIYASPKWIALYWGRVSNYIDEADRPSLEWQDLYSKYMSCYQEP